MGITRDRLPVVRYTQQNVHNDFAQVISNLYFCAHSSPDELLHQVSIFITPRGNVPCQAAFWPIVYDLYKIQGRIT